jgi:hypothetical protein
MPTIRTRPETLPTGMLLAGVGGFLDAYTFVGRGGVFANAQTGNIVLLAVAAGERQWPTALLHVPPILAFMLGVAVAETLARPAARRIVRRPARSSHSLQRCKFRRSGRCRASITARRSQRATCALSSQRLTSGELITMSRRGGRRHGYRR